jgi:hypothetical protein
MSAMATDLRQRDDDTCWVPASVLPILQRQISRLDRRARRLGCGPIQLSVVRRVGSQALVRLDGETAALQGWTLVAILHHRSGRPTGVEVTDPGGRIDIEGWSRSEGWCEHCRTRRSRATTYLLRHLDGRLAQVGSSCVGEFTDHPNALAALRHVELLGSARTALRRHTIPTGSGPVEYVNTASYLAHVAQATLDHGFVSTSARDAQRPATWSVAAAALDCGHAPSSGAQRRAYQALRWVRDDLAERGHQDEFERRLVRVLAEDRLTRRELPTAAAAIYAYHQHLGDRSRCASVWVSTSRQSERLRAPPSS